ncbi:hypothetical protein [Streptomyces spiralis]|uniref:hypothetical protein n=1 Tax=Streptomyces spiralis TaxID=66376 RepID=UPI0033C39C3D
MTTVFELLLAQYGVGREGLPGEWPEDCDDASQPHTPAWQEAITSRMYGTDAMSAFHAPPVPTTDGTGGAHGGLRDRVSLLNRNGRGRPRGLFPERRAGSR